MPKIWPVTALGFPGLFVDLGIQAVPAGPQFWLHDTIIPVSLVNSQITLSAEAVPVLYTRANVFDGQIAGGEAAGVVIADTGQLAAGDFDVKIMSTFASLTNATEIQLQHRDAANAANIYLLTLQVGGSASPAAPAEYNFAMTFLENERLRGINIATLGANDRGSVTIFIRRRT